MKFVDKIKEASKEYGGLPFWSWNDKLNKDELLRQIRNMKDIGFNGFFMHARGGLKTEYCSNEWYDCVRVCVEEAKKLNMEAWAYDENGWPSGFAGGKLLKDESNFVKFLEYSIGGFDENAFAVYSLKDNMPVRVFAPIDTDKYINIYKRASSSYVDVMDEAIVKKYIDTTHEEYKKELNDDFGTNMPGFFTDEPQYYRYATAWSDTFLTEFEKTYSYSVFDVLPALFIDFEGAMELRYDYWALCHKKYTESFAKQIYDWCDKNGAQLTGHTIEETSMAFQMCCSGGVMPFYEYEHIPGMDHLGRDVRDELAPKQLGSVAAQLGKKKVLTESFALCGWAVSPIELRRVLNWQFVSGVNLLCTHLYPYSERGERKYDYPAHYSEHLPWSSYLKDFNNYFANLGAALSLGTENANVLILHPIHSLYLYFKREQWNTCAKHIEEPFRELLDKFGENNVQYHLGDETIIARHGKVENNKFTVGLCKYDYVVIPHLETLDATTTELLKEFISNGGKVVAEGDLPTRVDGKLTDLSWLKANATFNDILNDRQAYFADCSLLKRVRINVRHTESGKIFFIANLTDQTVKDACLFIKDVDGVNEIDMLDLKEKAIKTEKIDGGIKVTFDITDSCGYVFKEEKSQAEFKPVIETDEIINISTDTFNIVTTSENYLVLDFASLSLNGKDYEPVRFIKHIHELLLKRQIESRVYLKFKFNADFIPQDLSLLVEPLKNVAILVNNKKVYLTDEWRIDRCFKLAKISNESILGENEIIISFDYFQSQNVYDILFKDVMESLRNCLSLDTEIEPVYLVGSFGVKAQTPYIYGKMYTALNDGPFTIVRQESTVDIKDITSDLYPFYSGMFTVEKEFNAKKGDYIFNIDGQFSILNVYVNNKFVKTLMFDRKCTLSLDDVKNTIRFEIIGSLRNTFGPLHHKNDELTVVCPDSFTFEGDWDEEAVPEDYKERYSFIKIGVNNITFIKTK